MNAFKTFFLMLILTAILMWIGNYVGGQSGMIVALLFAGALNFGTYWFSDRIVLSMYRAREVDERQAPQLYDMVRRSASRLGIPTPKVYIIPERSPNAFATGRSPQNAAVAVTDGITRILTYEELEAVVAHELSHVVNRDTLIGTVAATLVGAITILARWAMWFGGGDDEEGGRGGIFSLILIIIIPIAAILIQLAISRNREYIADAGSARLTHNPMALARALQKLEKGVAKEPIRGANPSTAHMFIVKPFRGGGILSLLSTHPPIPNRIDNLKRIAREMGELV
ncbi:MAG: zinc metalloprotease HtpX [bacterium]